MISLTMATPREVGSLLGQRLRAQRLAQALSQDELAVRAGVSAGTVKNLERKGQASVESLLRVVAALGLMNDLQDAFNLRVQSIAQMERAELAQRKRAPRKARM
ncbi:MAG: helix-turn-helix transcriptional regulator [Burkholderiales bacterium]|nr:helix-turn-helix transcriptional regulator [Burkholderiales bacterium]